MCFAMLADNAGKEHMGAAMGTAMSFVAAGMVTGPMSSGALLQEFGYWVAWSVPFALLALCFVENLLIIEDRDDPSLPSSDSFSVETAATLTSGPNETTSLISSSSSTNESLTSRDPKENRATTLGFYRIMFSDTRILAGLLNTLAFTAILSGFDATLPLHLQKEFKWDTRSVSVTFLGLQAPGIVLGPVVGWVRDRVNLRHPTTLGWAILVPVLWILGAPGYIDSEWANPETTGKAILIVCVIIIGFVTPLLRGTGAVQMAGEFINTSVPYTLHTSLLI